MMRSRLIALSLRTVFLVSISACTTTPNTALFNTAAPSSDAAAIAYPVPGLESSPALDTHLSEMT